MSALNTTLRAELAKLDCEQTLELLGEILEPSIHTPFDDLGEAFTQALAPITAAYQGAYSSLRRVVAGEE